LDSFKYDVVKVKSVSRSAAHIILKLCRRDDERVLFHERKCVYMALWTLNNRKQTWSVSLSDLAWRYQPGTTKYNSMFI